MMLAPGGLTVRLSLAVSVLVFLSLLFSFRQFQPLIFIEDPGFFIFGTTASRNEDLYPPLPLLSPSTFDIGAAPLHAGPALLCVSQT